MFKRIAAFLVACLMMMGVAFADAPVAVSEIETFDATAKGFGGDVSVALSFSGDTLVGVQIAGAGETEGIGTKAIDQMLDDISLHGTIAVDTVSGATITSNAILEAAAAALAASGRDEALFTQPIAKEIEATGFGGEVDVVVIGAGGAGMTAAITAADAGMSVAILESQAMAGGNSVRATGGMNAADTALQDNNEFAETAGVEKTLAGLSAYADNEAIVALGETVAEQWAAYQAAPEGYFDSVELMELDTMVGGKGVNDPALVRTMCENTADSVEWLAGIGADLTSVGSFGGASVKRIHRPVNAEGKTISVGSYIVPVLENGCVERGVDMYFNVTATEIMLDDEGKVCGVAGVDANGAEVNFLADSVIIATGGFGANLDMVVEYAPELAGFMTTNAPGIQGQGIAMATAIGAATVDMDQIQIHPTVEANTAALITEGLRGDGAILVNAEGKRFCDEVGTRDVVSAAEIAQTGSYSWLIVDQKMTDASSVIQGYINKGFTFTGNTYAELGAAIGVDGEALTATMEAWNACVASKTDAEFGRTSFANPLDTAPFYAVKVTAGVHHTMGGLAINTEAEVLDESGAPIENLYAAGEVTGGVHGANRLGGNAVADFVVFGRIAGANAAANAAE